MKYLLIILSILLLSSFTTSCDKKEATLYRGGETSTGFEWKTIRDNNNPQYKGEVKSEYIIFGDSLPEGLGSLIFPDESKYVGEWKDGRPNGQGTYTFGKGEKESQKYVGEWKDGKRNGRGTYTFPDGRMYVGEWKDGKPNGQGTFASPEGFKYVGEFKDNKPSGHGTDTFPDGRKYVGDFKDGIRNGQGTMTYANGQKYVGRWKNGKPWKGTQFDKDGNIIGKNVNGKYVEK